MSKKIGFGILFVTVSVLVIGFMLSGSNVHEAQVAENGSIQDGTLHGLLVYTEGDIQLSKSLNDNVKRAVEGQVVSEDFRVEVIGEGRAIINLDDGSVLRLADNTSIWLTSLDPNNISIMLEKGELYSRVIEAKRPFIVSTLDAEFESLGTAFSTKYEDRVSFVEVFQNKVKVKDKKANELAVVNEGKRFDVFEEALSDITDEELLENAFIQWNKTQDEQSFKNSLGVLSHMIESTVESIAPRNDGTRNVSWDKEEVSLKPEVTDITEETDIIEEMHEEERVDSITLSSNGNGTISWFTTGVSEKGYKIVWSKSPGPTYPTRATDKFIFLSDQNSSSGTVTAFDGEGTYYVRVCEYIGSACGVYSNQIKINL